jgi:hypothetical protein
MQTRKAGRFSRLRRVSLQAQRNIARKNRHIALFLAVIGEALARMTRDPEISYRMFHPADDLDDYGSALNSGGRAFIGTWPKIRTTLPRWTRGWPPRAMRWSRRAERWPAIPAVWPLILGIRRLIDDAWPRITGVWSDIAISWPSTRRSWPAVDGWRPKCDELGPQVYPGPPAAVGTRRRSTG